MTIIAYKGSLRRKVMFLVLASTFTALFVAAAALVAYEIVIYRNALRSDLITQANILSHASAPALAFDDRKAATANLALLRSRPDILAAALYTARGAVFATYVQDAGGKTFPLLPEPDGYVIAGDSAQLFHRVVDNSEVLGTLYLRARYQLRDRLVDYLAILLGVIGASLLITALLSRNLRSAVTDPILSVAAAAHDVIQNRDFSARVKRTTDDEVGVLVDAFNAMLVEVGGRATELETSNRNLQHEMAERSAAEAALRIADRRKDEFLATLAHELRNPLAPIANALVILRTPNVPQSVAEQARAMMERQMRQLVRLVDDLLDISRITTDRLVLKRQVAALADVIRNAVETARPLMDARRHELAVQLPDHVVHVDADPTRLAQVFSNLLNNAAKYTEPGGHILIDARLQGTDVIVEVRDDGIGIADEMLPSVFEMFVQVDTSLERSQSGLGVGLSLARRLVEMHGGKLEAHSAGLGHGSVFSVRLPVVVPERNDGAAVPALARVHGLRLYRILLVDDNVDFVTSMGALLGALGHQVRIVHDGPEALLLAADFHPQFVFLDIGLPGMDGYQVARRLRESPPTRDAILVAVTGWGQEKDRQRAKEAGFDQHLVKPVEFSTIQQLFKALAPRT
ncbi:MAG: ATP-binding protein [Betaproteobacteria bacterium]